MQFYSGVEYEAPPFSARVNSVIEVVSLTEANFFSHIHLSNNLLTTVELQWLEHLWDHENWFKTGVVRANEC